MKVMPASASASVCAATPALVAGAIAPARMNGVMMRRLVVLGVRLGGGEHRAVPHERRRRVDEDSYHGAVLQVATEADAGHVDAVLRHAARR